LPPMLTLIRKRLTFLLIASGLILITHDLGVVSQVTEKIAVMYAGRIVEIGSTENIVANPLHPYTRGLIKALPGSRGTGEKLYQIPGSMPNLTEMPEGCAFHPRCELAEGECFTTVPELMKRGNFRRLAACHKV